MLEIVVRTKEGKEQSHLFERDSITVGRAVENDLQLDLPGVSRRHARIFVEGSDAWVEDLGSTNGTFLDGKKITQSIVALDREILVGDAMLSVKSLSMRDWLARQEELSGNIQSGSKNDPSEVESQMNEVGSMQLKSAGEGFYWDSLKSFLAPIWDQLTDDSVSEVLINGPSEIFLERKGKLSRLESRFTEDSLKAAVLNIAQYVGRRVSEEEPYLDARLPDGSRVAVLLPPCARKGISIAIRKFSKEKLTIDKLLEFGSLSSEMVTFLEAAVILKKNIVVSGGTSSGKTSLLNVLSSLIPEDERIITIEDSAELQLAQEHVVPMETRPPDKKGRGQVTIRDLVRASLRMRPDRVIVGEIRSGEALDLLQAMNTGHSGSMATVHANNPAQALTRLETLALFSGVEIPMRALRDQVSSALDIVIQASRLPDHTRKVTHISEIGELTEDGKYVVRDIYRFESSGMGPDKKIGGAHRWTGVIPECFNELKLAGLDSAVALFAGAK